MTAKWTRVLDSLELTSDKPRTIRTQGKQIVLFRLGASEIHAIDNRCPHEGYPLSTGMLKDGVLTCEWHNWKFRLCDGVCIRGGEDVRRYPLRIEDGGIWLDLADPPLGRAAPALYRALEDAFEEGDFNWAGRTVERLLASGEAPARVLAAGCRWGATHARYGFDHGLAATADLAMLLAQDAAEPGVLVLEAIALMVESNLRRPAREPAAAEPAAAIAGRSPAELERELRQRIEREDLAGTEALVRGAIEAGHGPKVIMPWLVHAATDHFLSYGHLHIYCVKAEELLEVIGWEHAHPVLTSLASQLVHGTREDRLPYMRMYNTLMAPYSDRLDEWAAAARVAGQESDAQSGSPSGPAPTESITAPMANMDTVAFLHAVLDGTLAEALGAVASALDRGVAPQRIAVYLGIAAAHRLMRFDARLELDDDTEENWLTVTHALTHADAVHASLCRYPSAETLRGLFHSARFVQHMAPLDLPADERPEIPEDPPDPHAGDLGLMHALMACDPAGTMAAVRLGMAHDRASMTAALHRAVLADRATAPIFVAHHIKLVVAALRLSETAAGEAALADDRDLPVVAAARFLAHPLRERAIARTARVARAFVHQGQKQRTLLGY